MRRAPSVYEEAVGVPLRGGRRSAALFGKLFGLRPELPFRIEHVSWTGSRFEVAIGGGAGESSTFVVEAATPEPENRPLVQTAHISVWYRGHDVPASLVGRVREAVARRPGTTFRRLVDLFLEDPDVHGPAPSLEHTGDEVRRVRFEVGMWSPEEEFADFFAIDELDLFPAESIELDAENRFLKIQHTDLECHSFSPPEGRRSNLALVSYPWRDGSPDGHVERSMSTDLTDYDVITGGVDKVREVLESAMSGHPTRTIVFGNNCLPATTGEDVRSIIEQVRAESPDPILFYDRGADKSDVEMFASLLGPTGDENVTAEPGHVNLIGLRRDASTEELVEVLGELGVTVNTFLVPTLSREALGKLPRASLDVFCRTSKAWDRLYRKLVTDPTSKGGRAHVFVTAPFGMRHTRAWYEQIAAHLGIDADVDRVWSRRFGALEARWEEAGRRARGHRVGLVLRTEDLEYLEDPAYLSGVPLVDVLEEMGFGIDVLVKAAPSEAAPALNRVRYLFERVEDHRFVTFESLGELRAALAESEAAAVFSNHVFDWRLTEAGKSRFSILDFHKGVAGAVRTAERLVTLCETPFYARYSRYLRRTPMGLLR